MSNENYEIAVMPRTDKGSAAARRARNQGLVPAIVYSKGTEPKQVYLNAGEWSSLARQNVTVVTLVDGDQKQAALVKEVQINHLKNYFYHIDFQALTAEEAAAMEEAAQAADAE